MGNDFLSGDNGGDFLTGGAGADTFFYNGINDSPASSGVWTTAADWIKDFATGSDKIDLAALNGQITGTGAPDKLTFNTAGNKYGVWVTNDGTYNYVNADVTGDGIADLVIRVTGAVGAFDFTGVNHNPGAVNDTNTVLEDSTILNASVATNDGLDPDGDTLTYAVVGTSPAGLTMFNSSGTYSFDASNAAYQYLAAGQVAEVVVNYQVTDGHGGLATAKLTITVTGTNDIATITASGTQDTTVIEAGGASNALPGDPTASGKLAVSDLDAGQSVFAAVAPAALTGTYGTFTFNSATGDWLYTLDQTKADPLTAGQAVIDTLTVTSLDGTATYTIKVNITGTDDAAVFTGSYAGSTTEAGVTPGENGQATASIAAAGDASYTDVDAGSAQDAWTVAANLGSTGGYGTYSVDATGHWTYNVDNTNATVNALQADSAPLTDTFTITTSTGIAKTITVTINGANDAPVTVDDANATGENTSVSTNVIGNDSDPDDATATLRIGRANTRDGGTATNGSGEVNGITVTGQTIAFNPNHYTDPLSGVTGFDYLAAGETATVLIDYNAVDPHGANSHLTTPPYSTLKITVTGTNDEATISAGSPNDTSVTEDGDTAAGGKLVISDADHDQSSLNAGSVGTAAGSNGYGSFTVAADGTWSYTLDSSKVQFLDAGKTAHDTLNVTSLDGTGHYTLDVTINGAEDAPVFAGVYSGSALEAGITDGEGGSVTPGSGASGDANYSDVDVGDPNDAWNAASGTTTYGSYTVDATGHWTFTPDNNNLTINALQEGQFQTDTFTITTVDGINKTITVTIDGANDAPTTVDDIGAATENGNTSVDVVINDGDVDNANSTLVIGRANIRSGPSVTASSSASTGVSIAADGRSIVFNADDYTNPATNVKGFDYLAEGQTATVLIDYNVVDPQGASSNSTTPPYSTLTITITGTNDAPVITSAAQAGAVKEDTTLTATGTVTSSDVDNGHTATYSGSQTGVYGSFAVTTAGVWTYTLDNAGHQNLAQGESHIETFTVTVTDDKGATAMQDVTVTVTGTNDAPIITSGVQTGAVKEDTTLSATGTVTSSDVDNGHTAAYTGNATGTYGGFVVDAATGVWTYTLNNAAANVQALAAGESHNETFTVTVTDDKGAAVTQNVTVKVTGTNDDPVITSEAQTGTVKEDTTLTATGTVTSTDVDNGHTAAYTGNATGTYGGFVVDAATGVWTYTLNNAAANVQALAAGESHNETFTVTVTDDKGATVSQNVTVKVAGTNDAPVAQNGSASGLEDAAAITGSVVATDVDADTLTYSLVSGVTVAQGVLTFNSNGTYSFAPSANFNGPVSFSYKANDGTANSNTATISITVTPVNDAPVITSNGAGATAVISVSENSTAVTTVTATDVDGPSITYSIAGGVDAGKFLINATTGALSFAAAPNFEAPTDVGANNIYDVIVRASDGALFDDQAIAVTVTNVNEAPVIGSNGGGDTATVNVAENSTAVTTVTATDPDLTTPTYSIAGGADSAKFTINATTGALSFVTAPNFEAPTDVGANNVYDVIVRASDGTLFDDQAIAVTVTNVNTAPVITSNGGGSTALINVAENSTAVTSVVATDDGENINTITYSIAGGVDASKFAIDAATGVLSFIAAPNFEAPTDVGANNVYDVIVHASDGALFDDQAIAVTVTDVAEQVATNIAFIGGTNEFPGGQTTGTADVVGQFVAYDATGVVIIGSTFTSTLVSGSGLTLQSDGTLIANSFNNSTSLNFSISSGGLSEPVHFQTGGNNGDSITGTDGAIDILLGLNGGDSLDGAGNDDALFGGGNNDVTLSGGSGNDFITGGDGNDTLIGGTGLDILRGGAGADTLTGGSGGDTFVWLNALDSGTTSGPATFDTITDFSHAEGDKIDVSGIDANTTNAAGTNDTFTFNGTTATAFGLSYSTVGGVTTLFGDTDGNTATHEFQITLTNLATPLVFADFIP